MEFIKRVSSKTDKVEKYVFKTINGFIVEFSYIDNGTNKNIVCVPSYTMCNIGCKFCHTTDYIGRIREQRLVESEIFDGVTYIVDDLKLSSERTLLISYMGMGEPMHNVHCVIASMVLIRDKFKDRSVRFGVATCLPKYDFAGFFLFTKLVELNKLNVKMHLSLHYTTNELRKEWMPSSLEIEPSLIAMDFYKAVTKNPVEIHYALIEGVNDTDDDMIALGELLEKRDFVVKFLHYNEKNSIEAHASNKEKYDEFDYFLWMRAAIKTEYYISPGIDVAASCGMFFMDNYLEHGTRQ